MRSYPHMCRDGHAEIGHAENSGDCPMCDRIAALEAHVRRSIACIESLQPYVMWDGVDGEDEQTKVETTLTLLRGAVKG